MALHQAKLLLNSKDMLNMLMRLKKDRKKRTVNYNPIKHNIQDI